MNTVRRGVRCYCSTSLLLLFMLGSATVIASPRPFSIESADASRSLLEFGRQSAVQILFASEKVKGIVTNAVHGNYEPLEALQLLLKGTPLAVSQKSDGVLVVEPQAKAHLSVNQDVNSNQLAQISAAGGQSLSGSDAPGSANIASSSSSLSDSAKMKLDEIVVTAQKRSERLQDVPMSISALSGEELAATQSYRFEDYVGKIPGLTMLDSALGTQLVIRGLNSGNTINSGVATYIDETPYTAVGAFAGSVFIAPNLDTFDMRRIEVLRGPQGTLYGASALGGTLKYVTNAPDPSGFAAAVESGGSSVYNGGVGYDVRGMVNIPLAADAALRLVGYDSLYPGFIDDPSRGRTDINSSRVSGGRGSLLYEPTGDFSIRFNALYQNRRWGDTPNEDISLATLEPIDGNLTHERLVSQPGYSITQLYNVTIDWNFDFAKLLSATSYADYHPHEIADYSDTYGPYLASLPGAPYGAALVYDIPVTSWTEELRLTSPDEGKGLQWQVGGFFTSQRATEFEGIYPVDVDTKTILYNYPGGVGVGVFNIVSTYKEYAGFANLDYHFTPTVDVAVGGRYSDNQQTFHEIGLGLFGGGANIETPSAQGVFTYSSDIRWHATPATMIYGRVAEGYVPGGPNDIIPTASAPSSYSSSTTINYEVGIKSQQLGDRLQIDVDVFDINWRKIQLNALINDLFIVANGGTARSDGVEWSLNYIPVRGLSMYLNGAYTDARLTQPTPTVVGGQSGDRLPNVPKLAGSAGFEYERPIFSNLSGFAGADWRYIGDEITNYSKETPLHLPSYNIVDARAGLKTEKRSVALYVKNIGNAAGLNQAGLPLDRLGTTIAYSSATVITPRTVGVTLTARF